MRGELFEGARKSSCWGLALAAPSLGGGGSPVRSSPPLVCLSTDQAIPVQGQSHLACKEHGVHHEENIQGTP